MTNVLKRREDTEEEKHPDAKRKPHEDGAGMGAVRPGAQERLELQKLKGTRKDSPLEPVEGARPCGHLDFGLLVSRT